MKKILEMAKTAMFYIRVLSGYEERRIRSLRLQLEQRLRSAEERKLALRKLPEQVILSEVRRMVEEMQNLNKKLEDMETDIDEYFKPIDKEVEAVMNMQMDKEKAKMEMMGAIYKQALLEKAETQAAAELKSANKAKVESMSSLFKQALLQKVESDSETETKNSHTRTKSSVH